MLRLEVALDPCGIFVAAGNQDDEILRGCQRYWIAEAIRYTHREAVEELFTDGNPTSTGQIVTEFQPQYPVVAQQVLDRRSLSCHQVLSYITMNHDAFVTTCI
jgi:hypothetical protein